MKTKVETVDGGAFKDTFEVGDVFRHECGDLYVVSKTRASNYCLVNFNNHGLVYHEPQSDINNIFAEYKKKFTKVRKMVIHIEF